MKILISFLIIAAVSAYADDVSETFHAETPREFAAHSGGPVWNGPKNVLFHNGPWKNRDGTGWHGSDESIMQDWATTYGYSFQKTKKYMLADDFEIPAGETWTIESITFAGYQTGSGTSSTINGMFVVVYDDPPTTGTVVAGDISANIFTSSQWTQIYRVADSTSGSNSDRPIMANTAVLSEPWVLDDGTYWISIQADGTISPGPYHPPVVIWDQRNTGNAIRSVDGGVIWRPVSNNGYAQGLCIVLEGTTGGGALEQETWGAIKGLF